LKAGRVEYRVDKTGIVHVSIGKAKFGTEKLLENAHALLDSLQRAKPAAAKGNYLKGISVSSALGPGIRVDPLALRTAA
jgi:large subunit ribosomal protein L1